MSAPDYTQRLTDRIFLLSRGCPQMCQASKRGFVTCRGPVWRYADQAQIKNASAKLVDPNCFSWCACRKPYPHVSGQADRIVSAG